MIKIKQALTKMRAHTATYPNIMAIGIMMGALVNIEAVWFAEYILKPRVSVDDYDSVEKVNFWLHTFILWPVIMKFFGMRLSSILGISSIWGVLKTFCTKRN